jgi:hypothetical protein
MFVSCVRVLSQDGLGIYVCDVKSRFVDCGSAFEGTNCTRESDIGVFRSMTIHNLS